MKSKLSLFLVVALGLASTATLAVASHDSVVTSVFSNVSNGYERKKLPDGSFKPEYYAVANGQYAPGQSPNVSIDKVKFPELANLVAHYLGKQKYFVAQDSKSAEILLMISWGTTLPFSGTGSRNSTETTLGAMNIAKALGGPSRLGNVGGDAPPPVSNENAALSGAAKSELEGQMIELGMYNDIRRKADERNARLLGYTEEINYRDNPSRFSGAGNLYDDLVSDLEEERYYVIVSAYDFKAAVKEGKRKMLWSTRISIRAQGNRFDEELTSMLANASRHFGQNTNHLLRQYQEGKVDIGEMKIVGVEPPLNGANFTGNEVTRSREHDGVNWPRRFGREVALGILPLIAAISLAAQEIAEIPLAPHAASRGPTMFVPLAPAQTGIVTENRYADPRMWGERYQELVYGAMGTGVAVGDYDNDGRPDIFVASKTEGGRLFHNLGNWKFEDVTDAAGLAKFNREAMEAWQQGATFADVNNDGLLDLYVCRFGAPNLLFINQGNATFKEEAAARGLAVTDASGMGAFCDYDRDGWLDVYITTNMLDAGKSPNGQRGYLFHNKGDGTFTNVTEKAGISGESLSHSATWWDYDNDLWPDLYVANDYAASDKLYHNNRDGTFTESIDRVVPHQPYYSMGADLGDVDNDGRIDLLVADMAASTHAKDQRGMAYSRSRAQLPPEDPTKAPQFMRNALYLNTGIAQVREAAHVAGLDATDWTWSVRLEDLDNDGRLDLHVTNGMTREYHNVDLLDRSMAIENPTEGRRAVRESPKLEEKHRAFRNLGDLRFEDVSAAWGLDQRGVSFGAAFGDFDGDGDLDLVYANYESGVTVLRNDSVTGHRVILALRGTQSNRFGVGATVRIETNHGTQIRQLTLARGYLSSSEPVIHFGLGDETAITHLTIFWPAGGVQTLDNVAVDRRYTITEPATPATRPMSRPAPPYGQFLDVSTAANFSWPARDPARQEAGSQPFLPLRFSNRGPALAVGDIDGDGRDDAIIGGTAGDPARILLGGKTGFTPADASILADSSPLDDGPVLLFDADGDGANDVLVTKGGTNLRANAPEYQPRLYLNDGHGGLRLSADALPALPISVGAVAAADYNRDGKLDVFIGGRVLPGKYPLSPRSALLVNRGGRFEDVTDLVAPDLRQVGMVSSALWSDVDGDGWLDLLLALEWGPVKYFHNRGGQGFEDWTERAGFAAAGTGWWTSLASADFNGDGKPDFLAGNVGLNTQYHASPDHPALIYYGLFGGSAPQLIEAYYEGDKLYPWRTRKELGSQIPSILQRFPKNDLYARATLGEILGENRLKAAQRFTATEFRSGLFLSQRDGDGFRFHPLPQVVQVAPLQGIVTGDFDGDGHGDAYAVQNSFAPIAAVGRFDGGLSQMIISAGGGLGAPAPCETDLIVPGDAKAVAAIDLNDDGWADFLVTRNNGTSLAFQNKGRFGHGLRVTLRGPAGNATAIGARVTLDLADGSKQVAEVSAGSSYYSQTSAACFFGYSDGRPPRRLHVRWPNGSTSDHDVPANATAITVNQSP